MHMPHHTGQLLGGLSARIRVACPATGIISALSCRCLDQLQEQLGPGGAEALSDLQQLWRLAEGYGYKDWLVFDASVVRGLAYYTGK